MANDKEMSAFERAQIEIMKAHNDRMFELEKAKLAAPQSFVDADPDTQFKAMADARRGRHNPPLPSSVIAGIVSHTGATFDAVIDHNNKVIRLDNYTHPAGVDEKTSVGGLCPDGYTLGSNLHKQWKWVEYLQTDINAFVGKPLPKHMIAERANTAA